MTLEQLRRDIIAEAVPEALVTADDAAAIADHRELLLGMEDGLVAAFYDTLYAHAATAAVFVEGEREAREGTLRDWWRRTVEGPIDDTYWSWMALVGIVHIRRGVRNPMMISIATVVTNEVHARATAALPPDEAERLRLAFSHLGATIAAIISEAYTKSYVGALQNLAGLDPKLTGRMLDIEVRTLEEQGRAELG